MYKFKCVGELLLNFKGIFIKIKNLTNTFKLALRNEHNTNKTSYLGVEELYILHALSLNVSIYGDNNLLDYNFRNYYLGPTQNWKRQIRLNLSSIHRFLI